MWFACFEKKVTVFKKKDRETWLKIRDVLRNSGFKGVRASSYLADSLSACGCGSKLDPRNFGVNGKIDRHVYFVDVKSEDADRARKILADNAIEAIVEADPVGKLGRM